MSARRWGLLQVSLASLCFGFLGVFGKLGFQAGVSIGDLLTARFTVAALILGMGLALLSSHSLRISRKQFFLSAGLGFLGYAVFASLYFAALKGVSVALAAMLLYTFPFWTAVLNHWSGHKLKARSWLALAGALAGLVLLLWGHLDVRSWMAVAAGIGAAISYAIFIVVSSRHQRGLSALSSGFYIMTFAALGMALFHQPAASKWIEFTPEQATPILGLAIVCTVIPLTLIQAGLQRLSSFETSVLSMIEPVTAAIAGWVFLGEALGWVQILGGVLVLVSLVAVGRSEPPAAASAPPMA